MADRYVSYSTRRRLGPRGGARGSRRRAAAIRRRRLITLGVAAAIGVLAVSVVLPLMRQAVKELTLPLEWSSIIRQQAAEKRLDAALVAAVIYAETKYDPRPSAAGAEGPMQIEPRTAEFLARRSRAQTFVIDDLNTPSVNIAYGSYYLRYLLDEYGQSETLALAAYNGGETNVSLWLAKARVTHHVFTVDDIPFSETRAYVIKVMHAQRDYRRSYARQLGYS